MTTRVPVSVGTPCFEAVGRRAHQCVSRDKDLFLRGYTVLQTYVDDDTLVTLAAGEVVEVLDSRQRSGVWLVRRRNQKDQVCFVPSAYLRAVREEEEGESTERTARARDVKPSRPLSVRLTGEWVDTSEDEDRVRLRENFPLYVVAADYTSPPSTPSDPMEERRLTEGQLVEVMDMERCDRWLVQTRPTKTCPARQVWVPPAYLEAKTSPAPLARRSTREVFREDVLQISNKQQEATLKRSHDDDDDEQKAALSAEYAVTELLESEREYVRDLQQLLDSYYKKLGRRTTPAVLRDKRDLIFSNLSDILDFHREVFVNVLQASATTPATVGDCFLIKEKKFSMYVAYWTDHVTSAAYLDDEEAQEFLKEYSRSIGESELTFSRLLRAPLDRLVTYQGLLRDILRYTVRAGEDGTSLVRAITMLADIQRQVQHRQLLRNIQGLCEDVTSLGQLIRHDDVIVWDGEVSGGRGKDRHLFLFRDKLLVTKTKRTESQQDPAVYLVKDVVQLQKVKVKEQVREDERRLELWGAGATGAKLTVQTRHGASRQAWCRDLRELLKALGVEDTDVMPEKTTPDDPEETPASPPPKKKVATPEDVAAPHVALTDSDTDRTMTDADYASLSSYDSDVSGVLTAAEVDDLTPRPVFKIRPQRTVCQEGSTVRLECVVAGSPKPSVTWLKNGGALSPSDNIRVLNEGDSSALVIGLVTRRQAGQYTALAANTSGSAFATAELIVLEELSSEKDSANDTSSCDTLKVEVDGDTNQRTLEQEGTGHLVTAAETNDELTAAPPVECQQRDSPQHPSTGREQAETSVELHTTTEGPPDIQVSTSVEVESHTEGSKDIQVSTSLGEESHTTREGSKDIQVSTSVEVESHTDGPKDIQVSTSLEEESPRTTEGAEDIKVSTSVEVESRTTTEGTKDIQVSTSVEVEAHRTTHQTRDLALSASVDIESQRTTEERSFLEVLAAAEVESRRIVEEARHLEVSASVDLDSETSTADIGCKQSLTETSPRQVATADVQQQGTAETDLETTGVTEVEPLVALQSLETVEETRNLEVSTSVDVSSQRTADETRAFEVSTSVESPRTVEDTGNLKLSTSVDVESQVTARQTRDLQVSTSVDINTDDTRHLEVSTPADVQSQRSVVRRRELEVSTSIDVESHDTFEETRHLEVSASVESQRTVEDTGNLKLSTSVDVESQKPVDETRELEVSTFVDVESQTTIRQTRDFEVSTSVDVESQRPVDKKRELEVSASVDVESPRPVEEVQNLEVSTSVESPRPVEETSDHQDSSPVQEESRRTIEEKLDLEITTTVEVESSQRETETSHDLDLSTFAEVESHETTDRKVNLQATSFLDQESKRSTEDTRDRETSAFVQTESQIPAGETGGLEVSSFIEVEAQETTQTKVGLEVTASVDTDSQTFVTETNTLDLTASVDVKTQTTLDKTRDFQVSTSVGVESPRPVDKTRDLEVSTCVEVESGKFGEEKRDLEVSTSVDVQSQRSAEEKRDLEVSTSVDIKSQRPVEEVQTLEVSASVDVEPQRPVDDTRELEVSTFVNVESQTTRKQTRDLEVSTSVDVESQRPVDKTREFEVFTSVDVESQRPVDKTRDLEVFTSVEVESQRPVDKTRDLEVSASVDVETQRPVDKTRDLELSTSVDVESQRPVDKTRDLEVSTSVEVESQRFSEKKRELEVSTSVDAQSQRPVDKRRDLEVSTSVGEESQAPVDETRDLEVSTSAGVESQRPVDKRRELEVSTSVEVESQRFSEKKRELEVSTSVDVESPRPVEEVRNLEVSTSVESQRPVDKTRDLEVSTSVDVESQRPVDKTRDLEVSTSVDVESQRPVDKTKDLEVSISADVESSTHVEEKQEIEVSTSVDIKSQRPVEEKQNLEVSTSVDVESQRLVDTTRDLEVSISADVESSTQVEEKQELEVSTSVDVGSQQPVDKTRDLEISTSVDIKSQRPVEEVQNLEVSASVDVEPQRPVNETRELEVSTSVNVESQRTIKETRNLDVSTSVDVEPQRPVEETRELEGPSSIYSKLPESRKKGGAEASSAVDLELQRTAKATGDLEVAAAVELNLQGKVTETRELGVSASSDTKSQRTKEDSQSLEVLDRVVSTSLTDSEVPVPHTDRKVPLRYSDREVPVRPTDTEVPLSSSDREVPVRPPRFTAEMNDIVVELGQVARFDCRVAAYPDPEITWLKDGNKVIPTDRYVLQNFHDDIFSLLIKDAIVEDSGCYACLAKNEYGEAKTEAILNVLSLQGDLEEGDMAPSFLTKFGNVECIEGVPVEFTCQISGRPPPTVTWLINGREVTPSLELLTRQKDNTIMLAFRSVQVEHSGDIVCKLKNHLGEATCRAKLRVAEDLSKKGECPLFVERPSDVEVTEGGEARFDCVITGTPIPEVLWYFNGRELFDSRRRAIVKRGDKYSLILREVIADNAGVYTCKAVNAAGDASCAVELSVKEIPKELPTREGQEPSYTYPPTFTRRLVDQRVLPGRTARFECLMLGIPLPDVEWQKGGRPLTPSDKYKMGRAGSTAILEISNVQPSDAGDYTCILRSDAGKASSRAGLQVQEEPKARYASPAPKFETRVAESRTPSKGREFSPLITRPTRELTPEEKVPSLPFDKPSLLEAREDSVRLSWLPARTSDLPDNARRVTYTVEARQLPSNRWTRLASDLESTSYVARDLRPDKEYQFRVYAENKYGPSDPTLPASLPAREEPAARRQLFAEEAAGPLRFPAAKPYVMDIGAETVRIGWQPAEVEGRSRDVSYRVEAQKLPSEEWIPLASRVRDTSLYLSDLEPDRDYNIRVRAQGPYGVSQPTPPVWLPRATVFAGVPVSRPQITEMEAGAVRLQWQRVDVPTFSHEQEPLLYMIEMQEPPAAHWREIANRIPETYYVIHDLVPATDYRFRVRAETRDGARSEPSPATSIHRTLALSRPPVDRLQITDYEPDYQTVGLSWSRVDIPPFDREDEPLLYMIEYREPQADVWHTLVSGLPTTRYRVPDIGPAQDYQFRVRAMTPYGVSPPSHPAGLYRQATPLRPLAQDLQVSSLEPEAVRLSWQPLSLPSSARSTPSRGVSYQVEALEYPSTQWRPLATEVRDTTYQLKGLQPTKDYSFRVRAVTPSGLTEPTTPVTVTSLPVRPRLQGYEPSASVVGPDSVRLQWRPAELPYYSRQATPISYTLEMQEVPGHTWSPVRRNIPETSYLVTGLRTDRDYRFRVRPESQWGPGETSRPIHVYRRADLTFPSREPVISNVSPNSITLSWKPAQLPAGYQSSRPLSYRIDMREPPSGHWLPIAERLTTPSYTVNFLNPDKDYMFRVAAQLDGVESEPTASAFLPHRVGPPKMLREPPLISSVHPDSVWLSWRSVDIPSRITDYAPVTYRVEAQEPPSVEWRPLARHIPQTHYNLKGLRPGQEYNFRVRAENDYGLSEPTPSVLLKKRSVPPVMAQHEPLISDVSPGSLRLSWRPADVPSYLLDSVPVSYSVQYQHLPDTEWLPLARRIMGTSYYVTGLSPDNNYAFRVMADNDFGSSRPSLPARMPRLAEIPSPIYSPQIEDIEPSAVRLAWRSPKTGPYKAKTTTYAIETLEPSTWTWRPLVSRLPTPSYRVTSLLPTEDYIFRIRAETEKSLSEPSFPVSYSGLRAFSGILKKKTAAPPAVPVERPILSEIEADSVRVSWHPVYYPVSTSYKDSKKRYRVEMRELPHGHWHPVVHQTPQWQYEVTGLRPDSDYAFRVILVTDDGTSPPSNAAYLYRKPVIPRVPLEIPELAEVSDDSVFLRWNRVDIPAFDTDEEPLSFMIEAQKLPSYDWEPVARGVKDTSYRVTGLQPRQDYAFRVRAETPAGITTPTTPVPVYRRPERAGVPISYVTVDDRDVPPYSARLRWTPVYVGPYSSPASTSYQVEVREPRQASWSTVVSDIRGSEYLVSDLSPRKSYMFRVRAHSPAGDISDPSIPVPFYPLHMRYFSRQPAPDALAIVEDYSLPSRAYLEALIVKVPPRMPIEKPDLILVDPQTVHLTWSAARVPKSTSSLSPTTYRVEAREDGTVNWVERVSGLKTLGCDIRGLKPHLDYAFRVRAVNDFGWSEPTLPSFLHRPIEVTYDEPLIAWDSFTPTVPPLVAPRLPIDSPRLIPVTKDTVRVVWHPARTPAYARKSPITYVVEMKEPTASLWRPLASSLQDVSYQVTGLEPLRPYLFRVRAESEFGTSEPTLPAELVREKPKARSQSVDRQTPQDMDLGSRRGSYIESITSGVPPRVPTGRPSISNITDTCCTLSWPATRLPAYLKNTKLDYVIEFREASGRQWSTFAENVTDTSYRVTRLEPDQDYMFRVRAHNAYGTSEPTLPAMLERDKRKSATPQRRGSSVERRSLDKRSADRMSSERLSVSRHSLDRRSQSAPRRKDPARKPDTDDDNSSSMAPDETPMAPEFSKADGEDVQHGVESHPLTVTLRLRGYPPPQITWYHEGKELELGDRIDSYVTPTGQVFLEFLSMGWQDVGDYKCVAKNDLGKAVKNIRIEVADPPTFLEPLRDVQVAEHNQASLTCRVDGIPYPTVKFMKDWRPLTDTSRVKVTNELDRWSLTFKDTLPTDSGTYMCVAENVAGKVSCSAKVSVQDDAPTGLAVGLKGGCLEDNYYVLQELGRGRHGRVRRVVEKATGQEFAAKFIQVRDAADKEFFRTELEALRRVTHSNVVRLHDAYETPRQLIIVMELLPGGELLDRVVSYGNWTEGRAAGVVRQLLDILKTVHSNNMVHMDVKPSNLLLAGDSIDTVKLIDFGLARRLTPSQQTLNYGTPGFASPEVIDLKPISPASDVWGVGVLSYILLAGRSPFHANTEAESLRRARDCQWSFDDCSGFKDVSEHARDFISKILRKNPEERPSVSECLSHPWLTSADTGAKVDVTFIKSFQDSDKAQRRVTAVRNAANVRSLQRLLSGPEVTEQGLRPSVDPSSGAVTFPEAEAYGEFLDSEPWYDWQSRYGHGLDPDSGPLPAKDPEEIPQSLAKELEWLEQRTQAPPSRGPPRQDSTDSRRSSISVDGEAAASVPLFRQRLHDLTFETGDTITMYCALEGAPPYSTVWYKNEELLTDGNRVKLALYDDGQATLTITTAKPYDAGLYKCVARNKAGRASSRMRLLLGDVPERPGWPVVTQMGAQEAVVIWEAPRFDGNFPIQGYRVDYKARGDSRWTTAVYTPLEICLVSGLKPDTPYRFRVSAINFLGRGPFSWSTAEVTTAKEGSIGEITSGDLSLAELRRQQEKGKELLEKPLEPEATEEALVTEEKELTLQTAPPDTQYVLGDLIWKGRFGELRECRDKKTSQPALVEILPPGEGTRQFDLLRSLRHETLLQLLGAFALPDHDYLVWQAVSGQHALQRLSLRRRYTEENVASIIRQVLYGLQFLHRNHVVHLNLQPASLLLTSHRGLDLKLSDFSLSQQLPGSEGLVVPRRGYPDFMAPEVVTKEQASGASDVWTVGTLTFLLLSGLSPFRAASDVETLVNVAYSRYDVGDLQDGVSSEALRFLYKTMKRLSRNRASVQDCLDHKWLQLSDSMTKARDAVLLRSNRLRNFVLHYDRRRQDPDFRYDFDDIVLPPGLAASV